MAYARVFSVVAECMHGQVVTVEVDTARGLNNFTIVGLGDRAVGEARDRVASALKNSGYESPKNKNQKTVVSLSPADLKKEGAQFDLPIAIAFLLTEQHPMRDISRSVFAGELGLDGSVRPIRGMFALALAARAAGYADIYVPSENALEAALVSGLAVYPVSTLRALVEHLQTLDGILECISVSDVSKNELDDGVDVGDIVGQESAKRGLLIAASGGHTILLHGPPGAGKTMLARALSGLLPALAPDASVEVAALQSSAGLSVPRLPYNPPVRAPHHTASFAAMVGGGAPLRPGEITLAHRGVLFMDEFPEFDRRVIESLREPMESHTIALSRLKGSVSMPADFLLVAAMNPCPCGYRNSRAKSCMCSAADLVRYAKKVSGPILDRIDMSLHVEPVAHAALGVAGGGRQSEGLRAQVVAARERAYARSRALGLGNIPNAKIPARHMRSLTVFSPEAKTLMNESAGKLALSGRSYHRVERLARTIADLASCESVLPEHVLEALSYRPNLN